MQDELTPAEKRKRTLEARLGADWRNKVGQAAKAGKQAKHGEDGYKELQSKAGKQGGSKNRPASRPFKKDPKLAGAAGKKGSDSRWGNKDDK